MAAGRTWGWQRWIVADRQDDWVEQLQQAGCATWTVTERPGRARLLLAVYSANRLEITALHRQFGGQVRAVLTSEWLPSKPAPPLRIAGKFEVAQALTKSALPQLVIPHGMAFGSGEHATTSMLLRALAAQKNLSTVLDLGTGSGVLALAARLLGARKIVATDFDPDSVRTARENEELNFKEPLVRWQRSDVLKMRPSTKTYDLVLANLFSGLLIDAATPITALVASGGQLWQSGVLRTQENDVVKAYRRQGLRLIRSRRRGKWVMLQWVRSVG